MTAPHQFMAPWSTALKASSALATVISVSAVLVVTMLEPLPPTLRALLPSGVAILLATCALFTVRGYVIQPDSLLVQRLLWATPIPLRHLVDAEVRPWPGPWTVRVCGNGGLFAFTGWFWNRTLGRFRLFGTDLSRAVFLRFEERIIVVTPDDPRAFVKCLADHRPLASVHPTS